MSPTSPGVPRACPRTITGQLQKEKTKLHIGRGLHIGNYFFLYLQMDTLHSFLILEEQGIKSLLYELQGEGRVTGVAAACRVRF